MHKQFRRLMVVLLVVLGLVAASAPILAGSPPPPQQGLPPTPTAGTPPAGGVDDQLKSFDCSQVAALGIDRQLNMRAALIRIRCGLEPAGSALPGASAPSSQASVADYGGLDVQVNNALDDTFPHVTQSETSFAAHGQTVVATYNSSTDAPANYSGVSYSLDGGANFAEIRPSPFAAGHGTNYGDPIAIYSNKVSRFYTFWLASGGDCGVQGIGVWTSADGVSWSTGSCVHVSSNDDRENAWVDNNPSSPYYGRIYVSWNDFNVGGGALVLAYSADDGATWSAPVTVNAVFIRNDQGASGPDGSVYLATLDEGGGGNNPRQNWMFRSTDGGDSWNGTAMGGTFTAPGDLLCTAYFSAISPIWRYMGTGSLGVGPGGVLHYAYTAGDPGDAGNIYYTRSTDSGLTWSAPMQLNTDAGTRSQWMPSLAVTANGRVFVAWYDRRNTTTDDYQRFARVSLDNGATWEPDQALSDQIIPQPAQPDPNVQACYAGDYDFATASGTAIHGGWTDGRIPINSTAQQDVYADTVNFAPPAVCAPPDSAWQLVAGLPAGVYGPAVATDGQYVYAAGGNDLATGDLTQFARYDPLSNTWTLLAPLPTAVDTALAAYVGGKIYVFGGISSSVVQSMTQVYDIATDSWSAGAPMPGVRSQMGGGAYNGKIYLAGGYSTTSVVTGTVGDQTWEYDPATNSWATRAPMPATLGGPASAVIGGHLYLAGGRDPSNVALNTLYDYNIAANTWSARAALPTGVNVAGGAAYNGQMWVLGGGTPFRGSLAGPEASTQAPGPEAMTTVQIYDPATDVWSAGPSQNVARSFQGAAVAGGTIVSVGGYTGVSSAVTEILRQQRLRVLLVYADSPDPATLQTQLLGLPGVAAADLFNAHVATPTPAQLQGYDVVVAWSNYTYSDYIALGNELADFADHGGVVVEFTFDWDSDPGYSLGGRWVADGYPAFNLRTATNFSSASLGTLHVPGSPLLAGVNSLSAYWRENTTAAAGATLIADWGDATPALAVKGRAVGVTGYFGDSLPQWSGDIARIIANAGFSLRRPSGACVPLQGLTAVNNGPTVLGQPTALTATVSAGSLPVTYTWALGDGTTANGATLAHTYAAVGLYNAVVTAANGFSQLTATTAVSVYCTLPNAITFTWAPTNPTTGQLVSFNGTAGGLTPLTFAWAFGDGGTGSGAAVSHTYAITGTFTVALTVTNFCGTGMTTHTLTVVAPPQTIWKVYLPIVLRNAH
jgi:hypothetical protein